jgi:hypothetical protein
VTFKRRWSKTFQAESGPSEEESAWKLLDRYSIHDVEWRALLPR